MHIAGVRRDVGANWQLILQLVDSVDLPLFEWFVDVYGYVPMSAWTCVLADEDTRSPEETVRIFRYLAAHRDPMDTHGFTFERDVLLASPEVLRFMVFEFGMSIHPDTIGDVICGAPDGLQILDKLVSCRIRIGDELSFVDPQIHVFTEYITLAQVQFFHERRGVPLSSELWSRPSTFRNTPWWYLALRGCPLNGAKLRPDQVRSLCEYAEVYPEAIRPLLTEETRDYKEPAHRKRVLEK